MLFEVENYSNYSQEAYNEPSSVIFNALTSQDPEVVDALNNKANQSIKPDLIFSRSKSHLLGQIEQMNLRNEQHKIIENTSYGT